MKKVVIPILCMLLSLLTLGCLVYEFYGKTSDSCKADVDIAFDNAVKKEIQQRADRINLTVRSDYTTEAKQTGQVMYQTESDTIVHDRNDTAPLSNKDFIELSNQAYLAWKIPADVNMLDSIFRDELTKRGISTQTAVIYKYQDNDPQTSHHDSAFFQTFYQTPEIVFGTAGEIRFQGFAQLTSKFIVEQWYWEWVFITAIAICFVLSSIFLVFYYRKNRSLVLLQEVIPEHESTKIWLHPTKPLLYYYEKVFELTKYMYAFLKQLWSTPNYYLEYEQLAKDLYGDTTTGKKRLIQLVKRLRDEILSHTPDLSVQNVKKKGYQLIIKKKAP